MNPRPDPADFDSIADEIEGAIASMLDPSDELEIIASGHREIIAKRSQRIADRKKASKERIALLEGGIAQLRQKIAEERAAAQADIAADKAIIGMSRAALATVE